ncbi:MAG: MmgE/PrpD family protein [Pseudomonadota bacterium]
MAEIPEAVLVRHLLSQQARTLPQDTRARSAQAALDWFTAGWSGMHMPLASAIRTLAEDAFPGEGTAMVLGGRGLSATGGAFANAGIVHLREVDDAHRAAMLHPGVVAVSPVLALAGTQRLTQRRALDAIVAGYEVSLRVGEALGTGHAALFHATATAGTVGAAAAAGVALGLSETQLHHALGIAATQAAGLWQLVDDGAHESKSLHPAFAVRNGMMAAYAARAGLPGAQAFFTGQRGMYALLAGDGPGAALDADLAMPDRINTATIKAWPCCAQLFTPLDAVRALMDEHRPDVRDIASIDIVIFPHALKIAGVAWPAKPVETCFSLRYVVAALLLHGRLGIAEMETPSLADPALLALAARISIRTDDDFQKHFPQRRPARVTVVMQSGAQHSCYRDLRRGDPEDPFSWQQLQDRMRALAPHMDDPAASRIAAWCGRFADSAYDQEACTPPLDLFKP